MVTVIDKCDPAKLNASPMSPESTVKAYLDTADALVARAAELETLMKEGCSDVVKELGLTPGNDLVAACQPLAQRIATVLAQQPPPSPGPPPPKWFNLGFPSSCAPDPNERATCIASCNATGCDNSKCTPASRLVGKCAGTCVGNCAVTVPMGGPCTGSCAGACTNMAPNTCFNECAGGCLFPTYTGYCDTGCNIGFNGQCGGTCTGTCAMFINGTPMAINLDGGIPEGGFVPDGAPPMGADGNCMGRCIGQCSAKASGSCGAACGTMTGFKGGICTGGCAGNCVAGAVGGVGCAGTCAGTCTSPLGDAGATCDGVCVGTCNGQASNAVCNGSLTCGQNVECGNACEARALAHVKCTDAVNYELESVSDAALYDALKKKGGKLGAAVQLEQQLRSALQFVDQRTVNDFGAVGATGSNVRSCVQQGSEAIAKAAASVLVVTGADPTRKK